MTHIYQGSNQYPSGILYTWDGRYLYQGSNPYPSSIILTCDGEVPIIMLLLSAM